jgi:Flp pilus assembly protein TadG
MCPLFGGGKNNGIRFRKHESGQAMVELVLVAVIFLMMFAGIFDASRILLRIHQLTQAAREGARIASQTRALESGDGVNVTKEKIERLLEAMHIEADDVDIDVDPVDLNGDGDSDIVDVTVQQTFQDALGVTFFPGMANLSLRATISMPLFTR